MMKRVMTIVLLSTVALSSLLMAQDKNEAKKVQESQRLCKVFTSKVVKYKATMRNDELARATLKSYEKRAEHYCKMSTKMSTKVASK